MFLFVYSLPIRWQAAGVCVGGEVAVRIPRLSDDEVVRLVELCQQGSASLEEENKLAQWMWGQFYGRFLREGYSPEDAEDRAGEAFRRTWEAIQQRRFQF
jgi:hypothetical protein